MNYGFIYHTRVIIKSFCYSILNYSCQSYLGFKKLDRFGDALLKANFLKFLKLLCFELKRTHLDIAKQL